MKYLRLLFAFSLFAIYSAGNLFAVSISNTNFGSVELNTEKIQTLTIKAESETIDLVSASIEGLDEAFSVQSFQPQRLTPGAEAQINIRFFGKDNVNYIAYLKLRVRTESSESSIVAKLTAEVSHDNPIYKPTDNLKGAPLVSWLKSFVRPHTVYSYRDARTMMWASIDNFDGEVECVYSGRKVKANGIPDVQIDKFDTEHTWPQSLGADSEPPRSDLYHMRPTFRTANERRGSFPFGFVTKNISYEDGGSKLGLSIANATVFEPRDKVKGDVARGIYYFAIRYDNPFNFIDSQEDDLRQYMLIDPVDKIERDRGDSIAFYQKNRNPFIDYNQFIYRFKSIAEPDFGKFADVRNSDDTLFFRNQNGTKAKLKLMNLGDSSAFISTIGIMNFVNPSIASYAIETETNGVAVAAENDLELIVNFNKNSGDAENIYAMLNIEFDNGQSRTIHLISRDVVLSAEENQLSSNIDFNIFPNPISNQSRLIVNMPEYYSNATLKAVTIDGKSFDLSYLLSYGLHNISLNKNELPCTNCIIYINLNIDNKSISKPIIIE